MAPKKYVEEEDTFNLVLKLENVKVTLAVTTQEQTELRLVDVKKAPFKGRLHKSVYIRAPDGHAALKEEVWSVQLPIYYLLAYD